RTSDNGSDDAGRGLERLLRIRPLGTAEMREQNHLAILVGEFRNRGGDALDARSVRDRAILHRHIEIDTQENAAVADVGLSERAKHHQINLPSATAVSTMRLEKPHSLSYHDNTATKLPSSTLVWSIWNTDDRGS